MGNIQQMQELEQWMASIDRELRQTVNEERNKRKSVIGRIRSIFRRRSC
jgi:hypothetical protein